MKKTVTVLCMFLATFGGFRALNAEQFDYQNFNHGYQPMCERCKRNPCICGPGTGAINAPAYPAYPSPPYPAPYAPYPPAYPAPSSCAPCDTPCNTCAQPAPCKTPCNTCAQPTPCNNGTCVAAPCGQACDKPGTAPCSPCQPCQESCGSCAAANGAYCGICLPALGVGLIALAIAAVIVVSSGNGSTHN